MDFKAHYKDKNHDCDIIIENRKTKSNYYELSFTLDGITFVGMEFSDFELKNPEDYETAREKFGILKWGGEQHIDNQNYKIEYFYQLQGYEISVEIPVTVMQRYMSKLHNGIIKVKYSLKKHNPNNISSKRYCDSQQVFSDDIECTEFALVVNGTYYYADKPDTGFEGNLLQINKKCKEDYLIKCCFTCQYSDYSPFGYGDFGTMLCYKNHKDIYLTVNDKRGYFEKLNGLDCDQQQEINICNDYEERLKCEGYRGKI